MNVGYKISSPLSRTNLLLLALFVVLISLRDSLSSPEYSFRDSTDHQYTQDLKEHSNIPHVETKHVETKQNESHSLNDNLSPEATPSVVKPIKPEHWREGADNQKDNSHFDPPPCTFSTPGQQNFLMVFMGHSASSAILSELSQHSQFFVTVPEPVDHPPYEFNTELGLTHAHEFFQNSSSTGKIAGFKMRPWHILHAPQEWSALVRKYNIRLIWQYRTNVFKQAVGEYTARYLNDSSAIEGIDHTMSIDDRCKIGAGCQFRINNVSLLHNLMENFIENNRQIRDAVHLLSNTEQETPCVLPVTYEDYLYNREQTMRNLFTFLGAQFENHSPFRKKATSDNMCYAVLNFHDEICSTFFSCSKWRSMLHDPRNSCTCTLSKAGYQNSSSFCPTDI